MKVLPGDKIALWLLEVLAGAGLGTAALGTVPEGVEFWMLPAKTAAILGSGPGAKAGIDRLLSFARSAWKSSSEELRLR